MYNGGFENSQWSCVLWFVFVFWPVWTFSSFYEYHCDNHKRKKNWNWSHKEIRVNHNMHIIQKRLIRYALIWKGILKSFIISHILMTFMFDLAVVLLGEVTYRSVLGLRGLKLFHAFCSWHVVSSNKYYWMTWCVKLLRLFFFQKRVAGNLFWLFLLFANHWLIQALGPLDLF